MLHHIDNSSLLIKAKDFGKVRMGNSGTSNIVSSGDVMLETNVGCTL